MAGELLVGYDGTPGAKAAAAEALRLASGLGTELVFVFAYWANPGGGEIADMLTALRESGEGHLKEALALAEQAGVAARGELVEGRPSSGLVDLADEHDAQMIVVGSYGEPPLKGALIGSTAHKLLHLSERPVLVVRAVTP
jgi:nucleotide-binding universal stress UspA family protein